MTLTPAYGRDYKSAKEVKADWDTGKDFIIQDFVSSDCGRYVNKPQVTGRRVQIRYSQNRKVVVL